MHASNRTKVAPYHVHTHHSVPPASRRLEDTENDYNHRRRAMAQPLSPCCTCSCLLIGGLVLASLIVMAIAVPVVVIVITSTNKISSTDTTGTVTTMTTITTTTTPVTTTTTTAAVTATTTTLVTTTTALVCSPACSSQETCVLGACIGIGYLSCTMTWSRPGDGDIVVQTPNANTIWYNNTGPSVSTDQGQLDHDDRNGTGPENIFWSNNGSIPPTGVYYVCFEPYAFSLNITSIEPISVTINIQRSYNSTLSVTRNFTSAITDNYNCLASSPTLLTSFTYP